MVQKYFNEAGEEVEALPLEEANKIQEQLDTLAKEKAELVAEKERLEAGGADKDKNFVHFRTKLESTEKELGEVTKRLTEKEEYERKTTKEALIRYYAGDDEESRKKLETEYGFINLDESNPENISQRMEKAARVSGLYKEESGGNPVFKGIWNGSAPQIKPTKKDGDDADNVIHTDKGRSALAAMGVPTDDKK